MEPYALSLFFIPFVFFIGAIIGFIIILVILARSPDATKFLLTFHDHHMAMLEQQARFREAYEAGFKRKKLLSRYYNEDSNGYIYFMTDEARRVVKIGFSKQPDKRLKSIQTGYPYELKICAVMLGTITTEKLIHGRFVQDRIKGEWYNLSLPIQQYISEIALEEEL